MLWFFSIAPPHQPSFVHISILYKDKNISMNCPNQNQFEYRKSILKKKKKVRSKPDSEELCNLENSLFKIRILERMSDIEKSIPQIPFQTNLSIQTLNMNTLKVTIENVIAKFKSLNTDYKEAFNSFDINNFTLLHYICALDYYEIIPIYLQNGISLNLKSEINSTTPLQIAILKGNTKTVSRLVKLGVIFNNESDTAQTSEHKCEDIQSLEMAIDRKYYEIIEILLRALSLKYSILRAENIEENKSIIKGNSLNSIES